MTSLYLSVVLTALSGAVPPETAIAAKAARPDPLPAGAVARLGTTRFRPGPYVNFAALSPDGKLIATATSQDMVLLDRRTGEPVRTIASVFGSPLSFAFSPDGKKLFRVDFGNNVRLWDVATGKQSGQFQLPAQPGRNLQMGATSLSADGKYLAAGFATFAQGQFGSAVVWEVGSGKQIASVEVIHNQQVSAALSADGKRLATWGRFYTPGMVNQEPARTIQLWDVKTAKEVRKLKADNLYQISGAAFSPDGKTLAVFAGTSTVCILDVASGKELHRFAGRRCFNPLIQFSPDGKQLAVASNEGVVLVWDTTTWKRAGVSEVPGCRVTGLAFPAPGRALACGVEGQSICLWDAVSGKLLSPAGGHHSSVTGIAFPPDGKTILTASQGGQICRWDRTSAKEIAHFTLKDEDLQRYYGPRTPYSQTTLSPNGRYAAAELGPGGNGTRLWELPSGKVLCDLEGPRSYGQGKLAFSADGKLLGSCSSSDPSLFIWDASSGEVARRLPTGGGQQGGIFPCPIAFSPDGRLVAASIQGLNQGVPGIRTKLHCWRLDTGKELFSVDEASGVLAFSPDGKLLASANGQGIVLRETAKGSQRRQFQGKSFSAYLVFSPDGRTLAGSWASPDGKSGGVQVWELATGQLRLQTAGHRGAVMSLAYSTDGSVLASGGADTTILLWDMTGRSLAGKTAPRKAEELWDELASSKAETGFRAVGELTATPDAALKLFGQRLKPAKRKAADPERIAKLIAGLDAPRFGTREKANRELQRLGNQAAPALHARLSKEITPELSRRIEQLLARLDPGAVPPDELRVMRAVEVLEHIGTPAARTLLASLARGAPGDNLTREAQAAQGRLKRQPHEK
jgi:WD40 repeat protein